MNDYDDNNSEEPRGQEQWFEEAARRVKFPGLLLQLFGVLTVMLAVTGATICIISPEGVVNWYWDWAEDMQKNQPVEQQQKMPPREDAIKSLKIEGPIYGIIGSIMGVLSFVGGSKMKALSGYPWAMVGSIVSLLPGCCCCCIGTFPGIWSLAVLLNSDVKLAFARAAARGISE
ncbi:MAG: hypothetical protein EXS09_09110 [Gemmataceae bacterium]|nr:hypothetical protein [Gemmataceae bacterium]